MQVEFAKGLHALQGEVARPGSVGVDAQLEAWVQASVVAQYVAFGVEIQGAHLHFEAAKSFGKAGFGLVVQVAARAHPEEAVDGNSRFTAGKGRIGEAGTVATL